MSRSLIIGNWKMHGDGTCLPIIDAIAAAAAAMPSVEAALCLPATLIHRAATRYPALAIGGQDCHPEASGSYTGDIAASMIREAGGRLVILGHSERRSNPSETDAVVAAKVRAAQAAGLRVIVCVGETADARAAGQTIGNVREQLRRSLDGVDARDIVVAYEPVWAIGGGKTPDPEEIRDIAAGLRLLLEEEMALKPPVIYGGAVTPATCENLTICGAADGLLVGRSSLASKQFVRIMTMLTSEKQSLRRS